ncbi:MAG TPA: carbohydrate kinase family protein [Candidatus Gastranaerophilaceae bacterium]|nr:carbohydrate kinase family protein [Candidatus Gastranaerophilaceae bacterium]HPT41433.1 carbohydrate kinase family protein [Candidatus Gastranaerophilaceae bacterium]
MTDVITIGSATMDVFVECEDANIVSVSTKNSKSEFMSYPYGAKMEVSAFASNVGGGGVNTALNFANLGFNTSAICKIGDDIYSKGILQALCCKPNLDLSNIIQDNSVSTGFSIILMSFQGDRTVLAQRGANATLKKSEINFDAIKNAKLLYIAPLSGESNRVLQSIVEFANENGVKVCFNAGTTSLKRGFEYIKKIIDTAQVAVMNKEEAMMCTKIQVRPDNRNENFSKELIHPDIKEMLKKLKVGDEQIIVITDGKNGVYAYDGKTFFQCPPFPVQIVSTLGAGDAFSSTFCASLTKTGFDIGKSLMYASVNSASVVSKFGASEGFLTFDEIEEKLKNNPDYHYNI